MLGAVGAGHGLEAEGHHGDAHLLGQDVKVACRGAPHRAQVTGPSRAHSEQQQSPARPRSGVTPRRDRTGLQAMQSAPGVLDALGRGESRSALCIAGAARPHPTPPRRPVLDSALIRRLRTMSRLDMILRYPAKPSRRNW